MFLRQVRADQQQQTSNFHLRKPKRVRAKSPNLSNHAFSSGTTSPFTKSNINSQTQNLYEENKVPLQLEDILMNESDNLYDDNNIFLNIPNDSGDFYNISDDDDDQDTNGEFNEKMYDGSKKQNHYSKNTTGPYFPNYTTFLLFLWVTKHQIGLAAYRDFANIVKHSKFNPKDVPLSLATIKKYRDGLPLLPFKGHPVNLNYRNTPSTSKSTGQALIFPLKNILCRILANPQLREHMYFGPGIYCENKREIWHGDLWHKSPLFGEMSFKLNDVVYILSNFITYCDKDTNETCYGRIVSILRVDDTQDTCIKIERILEFGLLPLVLKSKHRKATSNDGCLWMTDDTIIINPINILSKVDIWLSDINKPSNYHGGLGVITSDLPEGNEQAGVKNHNANYGCRNCMIHHNDLHDIFFDIAKHGRYHHKTTLQIADVKNAQTQTERDFLATEYGIRENPSIFDKVMRDRHLQCPHDPFHCMGGMAREMLQATFEILTAVGEEEFLKTWLQWAVQVAKIFPNIAQLPNFHIQRHFIMHAKNFATLVNIAVPTKEMVHRLYKAIIPHSNKKNIELDFVRRDNCLQTLRFLLDGGTDERYNLTEQFDFNILSKDHCIRLLLDSWYISPKIELERDDDTQITCMDKNYINIRVQGMYKKDDLQTAGLKSILNDDLFAELERSYQDELNCTEHIASRKVKYFKSISYTIVDDDEVVNVNLHVGDVIDILEDVSSDTTDSGENEAKTTISYARIQAIFLHTKDQLEIPFLILDWFISLNTNDLKLCCPRYRLQRLADQTWRQIYVVKWVDHQPNVHFVHQCRKSGCNNGRHDENNVYYVHNIFYYTAI
ncbi:unnamed protein product [Rhizophagus irregularis]|nr:unnamed protein product [Rhizophagus irregularis]